jgi:RimJ/RimL family protein N-acetyltransferase
MAVSKAEAIREADCWFFGCWLAPEFRGKGLMHLMIKELDRICANEGWIRQGLGVWPNNERAIRAYKAHGFYIGGEPRQSRSRPEQLYIPMFRHRPVSE